MTKPCESPTTLVWEACQCVRANGGSAGVAQESIEGFESRRRDNRSKLWHRRCSGRDVPPPGKGVPRPKKRGGTRRLGGRPDGSERDQAGP